MTTNPTTRCNILLIISGLVVANVRNLIQYGELAFNSVGYFLATWLAHYLAIGLVGAVAYSIYSNGRSKFVDRSDITNPVSAGEFVYIIAIIAITTSFAFLFIHYFPRNWADSIE